MRLKEAPGRVLAIFAHPDDPEVACAGSLALWAAAGAAVHLVVVNAGDKGSDDPATDGAALTVQREAEVAAAAAVLGLAGVELLGVPDGEAENDGVLRARLVGSIRAHRPELVICPDPTALFFGDSYVNHHDHRSVGQAALDACAPMSGAPLYYPEAGPPHRVPVVLLAGTLAPDCWVEVSSTIEAKAEALACHRSQLGADAHLVGEVVAARAAEAAAAAAAAGTTGLHLAEGFRRLRLG